MNLLKKSIGLVGRVVGQPSRLTTSSSRPGCRSRRDACRTIAGGTPAPLLALVLLFAPRVAQACAVCFGNSDSKLTQGMLAGVSVLLFCVLAVLGGFVALFIFLARKAAATAALENASPESKA